MRRLALALLLLCALTLPPAWANPPEPAKVSAGDFEGTWFRVQRGERQALQIRRAESGAYEINFYWWTNQGFEIDTDFAQKHEFAYRAFPGSLELVVDRDATSDDELVARFERKQAGARGSLLTESGEVRIYRTGDGRKLVWLQDPMHVQITVAEPITPKETEGVARDESRKWIFRRVARRMVSWDEIPW